MDRTTSLHRKLESYHKDHGGERQFWLAWLRNEVSDEVRLAYRRLVTELAEGGDPQWLRDIENLEGNAAQADFDTAIEVGTYLVDAPPGDETGSALAGELVPLEQRIRTGIFDLLNDLAVQVPAGGETAIGSELVRHLTGQPAEPVPQVARVANGHPPPARGIQSVGRCDPRPPRSDRMGGRRRFRPERQKRRLPVRAQLPFVPETTPLRLLPGTSVVLPKTRGAPVRLHEVGAKPHRGCL